MTDAKPTRKTRDPFSGQYAYDGNLDRVCVCGHVLGAHVHGGFECGCNPTDNPETLGCECVKFRPSRKKIHQ